MDSRRKSFFISILKYSASLAVALFLFWTVYGDFNFKQLFSRFLEVNMSFIFLSLFFGVISYWIRAFRWSMLFEPLGYDVSVFRTFISLMVGYFANLLVPRMGEITRCGILRKTDNVQFTSSFGTVVAERTVDVISLLTIIIIGFIIEFDVLYNALFSKIGGKLEAVEINTALISIFFVIILGLLVIAFFLYKKYRHQIFRNPILLKVRFIIRSLLDGIFSIRKLESPYLFWGSTIAIWLLYFLMTYAVFFSFEPTMNLGIKAGILILIMGGLGMATPVQGGVGTFHLFVSSALLLYGISENDGVFFAFVLHTSQFLFILVGGGLSLLISMILPKRNAKYVNAE